MAALGEREPTDRGARRVEAMVSRHGAALLRVANQFSLCHDDALDAYQRALEIYLRRMDTLEPATEGAWLRVVVKHEAMAIRSARLDSVDRDDLDLDENVHGGLREVDGRRRGRRARRPLGRGAARAQAGRGEGPAAEGRRAVLPGDRAPLRVVLHEGQPLHHRGPRAVPEDLQRDRGGRGVRAPRGDADRARGRGRDERAGGRDPPAPAPLRDLPRDGARDALLAVAAARAAAAVRLAGAAALTPRRHDDDVRGLQRRWATGAGGGDRRPVPERRRRGRGVRDDRRAAGAADHRAHHRGAQDGPRCRRRRSPRPRSRDKVVRVAEPISTPRQYRPPAPTVTATPKPRKLKSKVTPKRSAADQAAGEDGGVPGGVRLRGDGQRVVLRLVAVLGVERGARRQRRRRRWRRWRRRWSTGSAPKGPTGSEFGFEGG